MNKRPRSSIDADTASGKGIMSSSANEDNAVTPDPADKPNAVAVTPAPVDRQLYRHLSDSIMPLIPRDMPATTTTLVAGVQVASIFAEPSAYLQQILRNKAAGGETTSWSPAFHQAQMHWSTATYNVESFVQQRDDLLHRAFCQSDVSVVQIQQLLCIDPMAASRPLLLTVPPMTQAASQLGMDFWRSASKTFQAEATAESPCQYMYPLNIAIHHKARPDVIAMLLRAAPQVASLPDGPRLETSLHALLRHSPHDTKSVLELLLSQPGLASLADQQGNLPLHVACQSGASTTDAIQYLCTVYPDACQVKNRQGLMPNELLVQQTNGSQSVRRRG